MNEIEHLPISLEILALEGNPVAATINYRAKVIVRLPKLKMLDGKSISPEDRHKSDVALQKECELYKLIEESLANIQVHRNVSQKLALHSQLLEVSCGKGAVTMSMNLIVKFAKANYQKTEEETARSLVAKKYTEIKKK